ncbi:MAG TPA: ABC transporter substrate-binding protein [Candidatus Binataceae bacterium]|nr:ABC transporter substrate-binding protein [Candidatus Binataceae bacterium]
MARRCIQVASVAIALLIASGCRVQRVSNEHAKQHILYQASLGDPRTFNPILVTDSSSGDAIGDVFDSIVRLNELTTLPEPGLAESWEIAPDQKSITFHLRHGVKWMDGAPFTSHDVAFTMQVVYDQRILNSTRSVLTIDGKPIEVETPDDYTVVMHLPRPFAPLLYSIGVSIIPAHILEPVYKAGRFNQVWNVNTPPKELVGLGPFRMTNYVPSQLLQYAANPDFWMHDENGGALPRLHGEDTLIVSDPNAQYLKFRAGQFDVYNPRPEEVVTLKEDAKELNITVTEIGIDTGELFFCFNRNPVHYVVNGRRDPKLDWFTDRNFLRAMAHAIDKQGIIDLCFHGLAVPAYGMISPANKLFYDPHLTDYDYNLKQSAELLEAAGYHMVNGVRVDPHGNPIVFNLTTNTGVAVRDQMCAMFKQDLASLGIKVNYRPLEFTTLVQKLDNNFDWDCVLIGFGGGGVEPNNGANFLRSSGDLHIWDPDQKTPATPWEAEIDKLLEQGTAEMDVQKRVPYYWKIQEILHDELPIIETVRQLRFTAYRNTLRDFHPTVWGVYRREYLDIVPD